MNGSKRRPFAVITVVVLWTCAVGIGTWLLWSYAATPGEAAASSVLWPKESRIRPPGDLPTLVMLVHPRCPCSRASIGELAVLMARCRGAIRTYVVFIRPVGVSKAWHETDLWRDAAAIPGVQVVADEDGSEAILFGAATSGQTMLYDARGSLRFSGGITGSRGHAGDNAGLDAVIAQVRLGRSDERTSFVFGCPLRAEGDGPKVRRPDGPADK